MDWSTYKTLCDQPDIWSRWMLEQCIELFAKMGEASLSDQLARALHGPPLACPVDFRGGPELRMFRLELSYGERQSGLRLIQDAHILGVRSAGTQTRGLGGFVEAWTEYAGIDEDADG